MCAYTQYVCVCHIPGNMWPSNTGFHVYTNPAVHQSPQVQSCNSAKSFTLCFCTKNYFLPAFHLMANSQAWRVRGYMHVMCWDLAWRPAGLIAWFGPLGCFFFPLFILLNEHYPRQKWGKAYDSEEHYIKKKKNPSHYFFPRGYKVDCTL